MKSEELLNVKNGESYQINATEVQASNGDVCKGAKFRRKLCISKDQWRCFLAEFLGTFVLIAFGNGAVAQTVLGYKEPLPQGNIVTINLCWGIGAFLAICVAGGVSQAHVNPAYSVALAIFGKLRWQRLPFYLAGQYVGAFVASICVYVVYIEALNHHDGGIRKVIGLNKTAGIWSTYPQDHVSTGQAFIDQVVGTTLLILITVAVGDEKNPAVPKSFAPLACGGTVVIITSAYELNCGGAVNPARDLAPRLFTLCAGWGKEVFSFRNWNWFWVPVVGPHIGAVLGMLLYHVCIGAHWPEKNSDEICRKNSEDKKSQDINCAKKFESLLHF